MSIPKNPLVVLEVVDRETGELSINLQNMPSLDFALNMLSQAVRNLEFQQRMGMEHQFAQKMMQEQADQQIRLSLIGGRKQ